MENCCANKEKDLAGVVERHRRVLWIVLIINLAMFVVEMVAGILAQSVSLLGDSLDILRDAATYAFSIAVVGMGVQQKAKVGGGGAWNPCYPLRKKI